MYSYLLIQMSVSDLQEVFSDDKDNGTIAACESRARRKKTVKKVRKNKRAQQKRKPLKKHNSFSNSTVPLP